jgi:phosphatidylethanolamine N-methyltransferase
MPLPEYKTHFLTKIFRSPYYGCYALAVTIFGLGIFRDYLYKSALANQPRYPPIHQPILAYGLIASGNILVLTSMWALGVTGTYLGDYFGILMDAKVEGFPFNITGAPMYWGSTMSFLGYALLTGKVAGLILTAEVFVMYLIALQYEEYVGDLYRLECANLVQPLHSADICKERHAAADKIDD